MANSKLGLESKVGDTHASQELDLLIESVIGVPCVSPPAEVGVTGAGLESRQP